MQFEVFYNENKSLFKGLSKEEALKRFKEMKQNQLDAIGKEIAILLFFMGLILTLGNMGDDDEDKKMKQSMMYKLINRGALELSFFFNPMDTYQILKRPLPILNVIRDIQDLNFRFPAKDFIVNYEENFDKLFYLKN